MNIANPDRFNVPEAAVEPLMRMARPMTETGFCLDKALELATYTADVSQRAHSQSASCVTRNERAGDLR